MLARIMNIGKVVVAAFWIVWIGAWILLAHLSEYFLIKNKFAGQGGERINFLQTVLFGMAHWLPLIRRPQ